MNRSVPIQASGVIPVSQSDVQGIPPIAFSIPDFEGQAILRIFSNSSRSEIACYSGVVTNGSSFSHPKAVGGAIGFLLLATIGASFILAGYGNHLPTMRTHYAHSASAFMIISVLQHVYFTGALSLNWPSVLVAFWSNFAWSGGMIYSKSMQNTIDRLTAKTVANMTNKGVAGALAALDSAGGGMTLSSIYKRANLELDSYANKSFEGFQVSEAKVLETVFAKRSSHPGGENHTDESSWYGSLVGSNLPTPGNYSGFPGTLSRQRIPASNAFITGFLWLTILITISIATILLLKWSIEALVRRRWIQTDRLVYFREYWTDYVKSAILRVVYIFFFAIMFLIVYQAASHGASGAQALAAFVFVAFFFAVFGSAAYAYRYRMEVTGHRIQQDELFFVKKKLFHVIPWMTCEFRSSNLEKQALLNVYGSIRLPRLITVGSSGVDSVHEDEVFIRRYGWLTARFRRTRWWMSGLWVLYEFVRACLYGGATTRPLTQVIGLLLVEIAALIALLLLKPFEGARLNVAMVYLLGASKILTLCFCVSFDARFNLPRISTTVIGIIIIVIQGTLVCALVILTAIGLVSSYMSVTRESEDFKPHSWAGLRRQYFEHIEKAASDEPPASSISEEPKAPYFRVSAILRHPKIEDEDTYENLNSLLSSTANVSHGSRINLIEGTPQSPSSLPFGAKAYRVSWSYNAVQSPRHHSYIVSDRIQRTDVSPSPIPNCQLCNSVGADCSATRTVVSRVPRGEDSLQIGKKRHEHQREDV